LSIGNRIKEARGNRTLQKLSELTKIDVSLLSKYEVSNHVPGHKNLKKIAEATGKPVSWFYEEDGQPAVFKELRGEENRIKSRDIPNQVLSFEEALSGDFMTSVVAMDLPVGAGVVANDDYQRTIISVPSRIARGATHMMTVRGKSMDPGIEDGDVIWLYTVDPYYLPPEYELVVANIIGDGVRVSHVFYREDDAKIGLGKDWKSATWFLPEELRIVGIVTQVVKARESIGKLKQNAQESKKKGK